MAFSNDEKQEIKDIVLETMTEQSDAVDYTEQVVEFAPGDEVPIVRNGDGTGEKSYGRAPVSMFGSGGSSGVNGIKVGGSGQVLTPTSGVVTLPAYETGAEKNPTKYLKEAAISRDGNSLTIKDNNDETKTFTPSGGGGSSVTPSDADPLEDGTKSAGSLASYSRGDHRHPHDSTKVDKENGKGLSSNDYTTSEKNKLNGIESGAQVNPKVQSAYLNLFENENMILSPFFDNNINWVVDNCSFSQNTILINGKGWASQRHQVLGSHLYMVVCFSTIKELNNISSDYSFYSKAGIGFRVRSEETYRGSFVIDIDDVSIEQCKDYVPIIYVFRCTSNCNVDIYFGELYNNNGTAKGNIAHAGLYDITDFYPYITYKKLYYEYKSWIENKLKTYNSYKEIVYPDSIAKKAFVERMNEAALCYGMRFSRFGNPSGIEAYREGVISPSLQETYKTVISPTSVLTNKIIAINGREQTVSGVNVYFYEVTSKNIYIASNFVESVADRVCLVSFWNDNTFVKYDSRFLNYVMNYVGKPVRTDYTNEVLLTIPNGITRISIQSDSGHVPVLACYSKVAINGTSAIVNEHEIHLKANISTCKDLANLVGVVGCKKQLQEATSFNQRVIIRHDSNGEKSVVAYRGVSVYPNWYIMAFKDGASVSKTKPDGTLEYSQVRHAYMAKNKTDGRCFAVSIIRQDFLPEYEDAEREKLNDKDNLILNLLNYADSVKDIKIRDYNLIVGTIFASEPSSSDYNKWKEYSNIHSVLMDVTEYRGYGFVIAQGQRGTRYTFLKNAPVAESQVVYATGFTTFKWFDYSEVTEVPADAKYLVVLHDEGGTSYAPEFVQFVSPPFDFSEIDWDACCVCEIQPDDPYSITEVDTVTNGKLVSDSDKWYGNYHGKKPNMVFQPYSTTKLLTASVALDYLNGSDVINILPTDLVTGSGDTYENGESLIVSDAIHVMLTTSDNIIAHSLGRHSGYEILKNKKLFLLEENC